MKQSFIKFILSGILMLSYSLVQCEPLNVLTILASGQTHNKPFTEELIEKLDPSNDKLNFIKLDAYKDILQNPTLIKSINFIILIFTPQTRVVDNEERLVEQLTKLGIKELTIPKTLIFLVGNTKDIDIFSPKFPKKIGTDLGFTENFNDKFLIIPWYNKKPRPSGQTSFDHLKKLLDDAAAKKSQSTAQAHEPTEPTPVEHPISEVKSPLQSKLTDLNKTLKELKGKVSTLSSRISALQKTLVK